jgi:hypothetical protein
MPTCLWRFSPLLNTSQMQNMVTVGTTPHRIMLSDSITAHQTFKNSTRKLLSKTFSLAGIIIWQNIQISIKFGNEYVCYQFTAKWWRQLKILYLVHHYIKNHVKPKKTATSTYWIECTQTLPNLYKFLTFFLCKHFVFIQSASCLWTSNM